MPNVRLGPQADLAFVMTAQRARLDSARWHFQHGPIDLVIGADGDAAAVAAAHEAAWRRFESVLDELVVELRLLRLPVNAAHPCPLRGDVSASMWQACLPFATGFITPMAAVAGAVADAVIAAYQRDGVQRAWVNNGGDIALHLAAGESLRVGLVADLGRRPSLAPSGLLATDARFELSAALPVRGVATSGWRGRSFSLGIADSVTVLARSAAQADAAATVIANAVDVDDPRIERRPACELKDDSDLGALPVTVDVPALGDVALQAALQAGLRCAEALRARGLIHHAVLTCQGMAVTTATPAMPQNQAAVAVRVGSVLV